MRNYILVYSYTGDFADTYTAKVRAENYGTLERNIEKVFLEAVEMTPKEAENILFHDWYFIEPSDDDWYVLREDA